MNTKKMKMGMKKMKMKGMCRMVFVGIDPGLSGAIVALDDRGSILFLSSMPVVFLKKKRSMDPQRLVLLLVKVRAISPSSVHVFCEKVHAMPKQGGVSMFNFGMGYGMLQGIVAALKMPFSLITPQAWQKSILAGHAKGSEYLVAAGLWPNQSFLETPRCRTPHSGLVDAALIAEYGRRTHPA